MSSLEVLMILNYELKIYTYTLYKLLATKIFNQKAPQTQVLY